MLRRNRHPKSQSIENTMKVEKLEHSQLKLTFDVTKDDFEKALDKAFDKKNKEVQIKGFRKGTAPRSVFEKTYGVEALYTEALDFILNDKVTEAVSDQELSKEFIGKFEPVIEEDFGRGKDFHVSLIIDTYPEVNLPDYKNVEVKAKKTTVSKEEVENAIKALIRKDATMDAKENKTIAKGDFAVFDFVGTVDGVEFEGGKADNYELEIGSGQFIPGFEDQMIGMKVDEVKDLKVKFPENYGQPNLAGKDAVFKVTVHEVKEQKLPELTEEYIKGLKIENAVDEKSLKDVKKKELEANLAKTEKDRQFDEIVNQVLDATEVDLPKSMVQERVDQFKAQYEQQAKMYNIPFDKFVELMGTTIEQFNDQARRQAERQALFNVVASKIVEVEKLNPSKEALDAKAEADSKVNGKSKEENLQTNFARYYSDLAYQALVDFLLGVAKEVEGEPNKLGKAEAKKTPAKKTAAKKAEATEEKAPAKKTAAKKTEATEEKAPAKKTTAKKTTAKKSEDAEEKTPAKKAPAKKTTSAKKTTTKKAE